MPCASLSYEHMTRQAPNSLLYLASNKLRNKEPVKRGEKINSISEQPFIAIPVHPSRCQARCHYSLKPACKIWSAASSFLPCHGCETIQLVAFQSLAKTLHPSSSLSSRPLCKIKRWTNWHKSGMQAKDIKLCMFTLSPDSAVIYSLQMWWSCFIL